jgi:DNA repair photolyase
MVAFLAQKGRVLVPIGVSCPFGCQYCYTRDNPIGEEMENPAEILSSLRCYLQEHGHEVRTIQFGYDGDPFATPIRAMVMLKALSNMGKHVNFSTKAHIHDTLLCNVQQLRQQMPSHLVFSALVSLNCWQSASYIEPRTPAPYLRMQTVNNLRGIGVPAFIAVRPIHPHIGDAEYEKIADMAQDAGAQGFVLGPLYDDMAGSFTRFIPQGVLQAVPYSRDVVPWFPHQPTWDRYEDPDQLARLIDVFARRAEVFTSSADAMKWAALRVTGER